MTTDEQLCLDCRQRPAAACYECYRAHAFGYYRAIERHWTEPGEELCLFCETDGRDLCWQCWGEHMVEHRRIMREGGHTIRRWDDPPWSPDPIRQWTAMLLDALDSGDQATRKAVVAQLRTELAPDGR